METTLAVAAAVVATVFALELARSAVRRYRLHAAVWAAAMGMYALATWALAAGLGLGWSEGVFRTFYLLGAIANIPFLAAGSVALGLGERVGRLTLWGVIVFVVAGAIVTWMAPLAGPVDQVGVPEGSELFGFTVAVGGVTLPGPRVFAAVAGSAGTVTIVGLALVSLRRAWSSNRRLAVGNALIVAGVLSPALGGSLTALGAGGGLALSLLVGAGLLFAGYRMAAAARSPRVPEAMPVRHDS